ncbi:polyphenol oxidase family protein [Treponema sp.]|uniref:polyphenol oxidase family protein n=1 Tax=Treponema sp. TaxID=166 RepID=UPI0025EDC753|nr:polyphenol oxidase family protein [Treponema sp.]MCR5218237.1 polyphenol oxidase family protein [Treponema sp.]
MEDLILSQKFIDSPDSPVWGMSLKAAGSMRFRWNEVNPNRLEFLNRLSFPDKIPAQVELYHSQEVVFIKDADDCKNVRADGIITQNKSLIPLVTVADCMPIFMYDPVTSTVAVLHSGWKGTGIVKNALELALKKTSARPEDFKIVLGPHIHDCCYNVDEERAEYFSSNFTPECVRNLGQGQYALSLARANLALLKKCGVPEENICVRPECTCCNDKFGSFRRETAAFSYLSPEEKAFRFTVQAAFVKF